MFGNSRADQPVSDRLDCLSSRRKHPVDIFGGVVLAVVGALGVSHIHDQIVAAVKLRLGETEAHGHKGAGGDGIALGKAE